MPTSRAASRAPLRFRRAFACAAPLVALACGGGDAGRTSVVRYFAEDATELYRGEVLLEAGPRLPVACAMRSGAGGVPAIECDLGDSAGEPRRLELEVSGANAVRLRVASAERSPPVATVATGDDRWRYGFELPAATSGALRIAAEGLAASTFELVGATLRPLRPAATARERALSRAWKFDFGGEWRTGLLALPGAGHDWEIDDEIAPGSELRTACAAAEGSLEFRIVVEPVAGGGGASRVHELPECANAGAWHDARIGLDGFSGTAIRARLESAGGEESAWGAWAEPVVVPRARSDRRPDQILVVLDTVRADRLTPYRPGLATTPFLDRWFRDHGIVFESAVAPAPWTLTSHASLFSGLEAFRHGVFDTHDTGVLPVLDTVPKRLRAAGYRTVALTAAGYVHPRFGFATGFDRYAYLGRETGAEELERNLERLRAWLADGDGRPTFVFFHTYEAHVPLRAREPFFTRLGGARSDLEVFHREARFGPDNGFRAHRSMTLRELAAGEARDLVAGDASTVTSYYDSALAFADDRLAAAFADLERAGTLDRALVVVTSDHGEALGEHGRSGHAHLDDSVLRIPLLVAFPDRRGRGTRVPDLVRLLDLAPTFCALAGVEPPRVLDGRSLLDVVARRGPRRAVAASYAASNNQGLALLTDAGRKLVLRDAPWRHVGARLQLFTPAADAAEARDLSAAEPAETRRLDELAAALLGRALPGLRIALVNRSPAAVGFTLRHGALDPHSLKRLRGSAPFDWGGPGRARVVLPAGGAEELALIDAPPGRLDLEGEIELGGCAAPVEFARHGEAPERREAVLGFDPERCSESTGTAPVRVTLAWRAGLAATATADASAERDLEQELRALGYL